MKRCLRVATKTVTLGMRQVLLLPPETDFLDTAVKAVPKQASQNRPVSLRNSKGRE